MWTVNHFRRSWGKSYAPLPPLEPPSPSRVFRRYPPVFHSSDRVLYRQVASKKLERRRVCDIDVNVDRKVAGHATNSRSRDMWTSSRTDVVRSFRSFRQKTCGVYNNNNSYLPPRFQ